jgi:hypothetical protein
MQQCLFYLLLGEAQHVGAISRAVRRSIKFNSTYSIALHALRGSHLTWKISLFINVGLCKTSFAYFLIYTFNFKQII